jgi:hypothetical protein
MHLSREDADALLPALRTLFGDAGFPIDAPVPGRWYLRLPPGAQVPSFAAPGEALGADLFDALVGTDPARDANRRRWRTLLSEAQVILHNHAWNAQRAQRGLAPVNSLWFWGGGSLPDQVRGDAGQVLSDDVLLQALAGRAGMAAQGMGDTGFAAPARDTLIDLRGARDAAVVSQDWLAPALAALRQRTLAALQLDLEDGTRYRLLAKHRWRWWRQPAQA